MEDPRQALLEDVRKERSELNLSPLLKREFQPAVGAPATDGPQSSIRIMQWNLLAQALSTGDDNFVMCPKEALAWDNRRLHVLEEILTYNAHIVCLEEVDHIKYVSDSLAKAGYDGCFFPKPDSPCLYTEDSVGPDGCAMFWKQSDVELLTKQYINLCTEVGQTNQVAILCKFLLKASRKEFFVAVTHLKSKKPYFELRRDQGKYLENLLVEQTENSPLVVCGDFNAEPSEQVYAVFKTSTLNLGSAYCHLSPDLKEPDYTTWKIRGGWKGKSEDVHCIDYMFYSTSHLQPLALLKMPTGEEIGENRLPSFSYPSDHLSLVVDFAFKQ